MDLYALPVIPSCQTCGNPTPSAYRSPRGPCEGACPECGMRFLRGLPVIGQPLYNKYDPRYLHGFLAEVGIGREYQGAVVEGVDYGIGGHVRGYLDTLYRDWPTAHSLLVLGGPGTGKSSILSLASQVGFRVLGVGGGWRIHYYPAVGFGGIRQLLLMAERRSLEEPDRRLLYESPLLLVDDLDLALRHSPRQQGEIAGLWSGLMEARHRERLATVVAANMGLAELQEMPQLARWADRWKQRWTVAVITSDSQRGQKALASEVFEEAAREGS